MLERITSGADKVIFTKVEQHPHRPTRTSWPPGTSSCTARWPSPRSQPGNRRGIPPPARGELSHRGRGAEGLRAGASTCPASRCASTGCGARSTISAGRCSRCSAPTAASGRRRRATCCAGASCRSAKASCTSRRRCRRSTAAPSCSSSSTSRRSIARRSAGCGKPSVSRSRPASPSRSLATLYAGRLEQRLERQRARDVETARDLQRLSSQLLTAQEEERRSIARELHDEVGQVLTAIKVELAVAQRSVEAAGVNVDALHDARKITDGALHTVRDLSRLLHPVDARRPRPAGDDRLVPEGVRPAPRHPHRAAAGRRARSGSPPETEAGDLPHRPGSADQRRQARAGHDLPRLPAAADPHRPGHDRRRRRSGSDPEEVSAAGRVARHRPGRHPRARRTAARRAAARKRPGQGHAAHGRGAGARARRWRRSLAKLRIILGDDHTIVRHGLRKILEERRGLGSRRRSGQRPRRGQEGARARARTSPCSTSACRC